jgi:hypothetical protein
VVRSLRTADCSVAITCPKSRQSTFGPFYHAAFRPLGASVRVVTYLFMLGNRFTDAWTKGHSRFGGATCCQEDLTVADSELTQRIDQVFTRNHVSVIKSQLVGDAIVGDVGYWPSDHAAVESQLQVGSVP